MICCLAFKSVESLRGNTAFSNIKEKDVTYTEDEAAPKARGKLVNTLENVKVENILSSNSALRGMLLFLINYSLSYCNLSSSIQRIREVSERGNGLPEVRGR